MSNLRNGYVALSILRVKGHSLWTPDQPALFTHVVWSPIALSSRPHPMVNIVIRYQTKAWFDTIIPKLGVSEICI